MRKELVQIVRGGVLGVALLALCGSAGSAQEAVVVGGLTPSVRPAGLPSIQGIHNGIEWYRKALTGVSQPYPASLVWLVSPAENATDRCFQDIAKKGRASALPFFIAP